MANHPTAAELRFAEQVMDALSVADGLGAPATPGTEARVGFSVLYAYATDPSFEPDPTTLRALEDDPRLRADFQRLIRNTALVRMPEVAAAGTGDIEAREAEGCRIVFRPSRADDKQIYVIVEMRDRTAPPPSMLFICYPDESCRRVSLPEGRDGRFQLLLEADSDVARGLRDIATEVFVK